MVIKPLTKPNLSFKTLTNGAKPLVVQDALEMILSEFLYWSALTPKTYVGMSSPFAGAVTVSYTHLRAHET